MKNNLTSKQYVINIRLANILIRLILAPRSVHYIVKGYGAAIAETLTWEGGGPEDAVNYFF
jgi:hypothetical protein